MERKKEILCGYRRF